MITGKKTLSRIIMRVTAGSTTPRPRALSFRESLTVDVRIMVEKARAVPALRKINNPAEDIEPVPEQPGPYCICKERRHPVVCIPTLVKTTGRRILAYFDDRP
ncbi:hypothetical protein PM082_007724 [Marasmius tenuissimus]|nr:hypothetical protein PM082_007724 [Marasmius tenuissimus]